MEEKKPYVRYHITADIEEKGIGYALKQAVQNYLQHHQLEGRIVKFNSTSSVFEGTLELYPGSRLDINMTALMEHIAKSGRASRTRK